MTGTCLCGCGLATPLATRNRRELGHVKGQPISFVNGHQMNTPDAIARRSATRAFGFLDYDERNCDYVTPCWIFRKQPTDTGYTHWTDGRMAHRAFYEHHVGAIPDGLVLDHLCRNRQCVNPAHLEPVTQRENILRGIGASARNARKTHCKRGHEFTEENTYTYATVHGTVGRQCRECIRIRDRARRQALAVAITCAETRLGA